MMNEEFFKALEEEYWVKDKNWIFREVKILTLFATRHLYVSTIPLSTMIATLPA